MGGGKKADKTDRPIVPIEYEEHFVYKSLVEQLNDPSSLRRESACWMLGELRYRAADKAISKLLTQDKDPLVRYGATHALERIADSWAVQAIIRGLKDKDDLVRRACIISLSRLQDKQAIYPLEALIKSEEDEELRILAKEALLNINGKKLKNTSSNERKIYKYLRQTELNPDSANAHYNLSVAYYHAKRLKESKEHCDKARKLGANVGWLVDQLANVDAEAAAASAAEAALEAAEKAENMGIEEVVEDDVIELLVDEDDEDSLVDEDSDDIDLSSSSDEDSSDKETVLLS